MSLSVAVKVLEISDSATIALCAVSSTVLTRKLASSRSDSGGASSPVVATKRLAVGGHVVLVEVGWVAHCWIGIIESVWCCFVLALGWFLWVESK